MIYSLLSLIAFIWYIIWVYRNIGIPKSISDSFYYSKTRWTYTVVIGGIGGLMTFVEPFSFMHYAGFALVLGTAAPHFKHAHSFSKLVHFGGAGLAALLGWSYVFDSIIIGIGGGLLLGAAKLIENKIPNSVFWAEVVLFTIALSYATIKQII